MTRTLLVALPALFALNCPAGSVSSWQAYFGQFGFQSLLRPTVCSCDLWSEAARVRASSEARADHGLRMHPYLPLGYCHLIRVGASSRHGPVSRGAAGLGSGRDGPVAPYLSRPILRHILVRREAAELEDGLAGRVVAIQVGLSCCLSESLSVEELWNW